MRLFLFLFLFPALIFAQHFPGEFTEVNSTGAACDKVFEHVKYSANFVLTGIGGTTAVLNLQSSEKESFLNGLTQMGYYGGMQADFKVDKTYQKGSEQIYTVAEGLVDPKFITFTQIVEFRNSAGKTICTATASFSSFH